MQVVCPFRVKQRGASGFPASCRYGELACHVLPYFRTTEFDHFFSLARWDEDMATDTTQSRPLEAGVFNTVDSARKAVQDLRAAGFTQEQITVVCSNETKERHFSEFDH